MGKDIYIEIKRTELRYGDNRTIHGTKHLDIETDSKGKVVAVWFRCMTLPFKQSYASKERVKEMAGHESYPLKAVVFDLKE